MAGALALAIECSICGSTTPNVEPEPVLRPWIHRSGGWNGLNPDGGPCIEIRLGEFPVADGSLVPLILEHRVVVDAMSETSESRFLLRPLVTWVVPVESGHEWQQPGGATVRFASGEERSGVYRIKTDEPGHVEIVADDGGRFVYRDGQLMEVESSRGWRMRARARAGLIEALSIEIDGSVRQVLSATYDSSGQIQFLRSSSVVVSGACETGLLSQLEITTRIGRTSHAMKYVGRLIVEVSCGARSDTYTWRQVDPDREVPLGREFVLPMQVSRINDTILSTDVSRAGIRWRCTFPDGTARERLFNPYSGRLTERVVLDE